MVWLNNEKRLLLLEDRFMRHMEVEERTLRLLTDHSEQQGEKIEKIMNAISDINSNMHAASLTAEIKCAKDRDMMRKEMAENYATKKELNDGLATIRNAAKMIWATMAVMASVSIWVYDKIISLHGTQ
jgi:anti-sigma-K factor RskA